MPVRRSTPSTPAEVADVLNDAVIVCDAQGRAVRWNEAATELFGIAKTVAVGQSLEDLLRAEATSPRLAEVLARARKQGSWRGELLFASEGKRAKWVDVALRVAPGLGAGALVCQARESDCALLDHKLQALLRSACGQSGSALFTELVVALATALEAKVVGLWEVDKDLRTTTLAAWIEGKPAPTLSCSMQRAPFSEILSRGACVLEVGDEAFVDTPELAEQRLRSCVGSTLVDASGQVIGVLAVLSAAPTARPATATAAVELCAVRGAAELQRERAVVEQRRVEARTQQTRKMEALSRLAGGAAHDFNNVLTTITLHSELLLGSAKAGSSLHSDLTEVRKAAERASAITSQLLAVSRKQAFAPQVLDLRKVLSETEGMLRRLLGEAIEIRIETASEARFVETDRAQLEQTLTALASNARDAMQGKGRLVIETSRVERRERGEEPVGPCVCLSIRDEGCGMTEEVLSHLFEPFYSTKGKGKGKGLGLCTVYNTVFRSGGDIVVESRPSQGTTLHLFFPAAKAPGQSAQPGHKSSPAQPGASKETVLLVEGEEHVRRVTARLLLREGYSVLLSASAEEALQLCQEHAGPIDLLLTDVKMPRISGRDLYARVRQLKPELKVLFMSAGLSDEMDVGKEEQGDAPFLQKPFKLDSLVRKMREALEN